MKYRILRPSDLVRLGDERWDFELGWTRVKDKHLERFSRQYRRAGKEAWRFRRPVTVRTNTITTEQHSPSTVKQE